MLRVPALTAATVLAALVSACATPAAENKADYQAPVYRTGSNIPVRDGSSTSNIQTADPESIKSQIRPSMPASRGN